MERWTINCESCERHWALAGSFSFYEQQTLESHPCPHCGAYTLRCGKMAKSRKVRVLCRGLSLQTPTPKLVAG